MSAVALTIAAQQFLNKLGISCHSLLITVITIDKHQQMASLYTYLRALVVAGRGTHSTQCVTIDGQPMNVDESAANAFIRFPLATNAQR